MESKQKKMDRLADLIDQLKLALEDQMQFIDELYQEINQLHKQTGKPVEEEENDAKGWN